MKDLFEHGVSYRTFILNIDKDIRRKLMSYYIPIDIKDKYRLEIDTINVETNIIYIADEKEDASLLYLAVLEKLISANKNLVLRVVHKNSLQHAEAVGDNNNNIIHVVVLDAELNIKKSLHDSEECLADLKHNEGKEELQHTADCIVERLIGVLQ